VDGNKRVAWLLAEILMDRSGYKFEAAEGEAIDDVVVDVATGDMSFDELTHWFEIHLSRRVKP